MKKSVRNNALYKCKKKEDKKMTVEEKMIERINKEISYALHLFKNFGSRDECYQRNITKIHGMIDMLTILTGNDYVITEAGLKEVK